jgi:hypothetical protein
MNKSSRKNTGRQLIGSLILMLGMTGYVISNHFEHKASKISLIQKNAEAMALKSQRVKKLTMILSSIQKDAFKYLTNPKTPNLLNLKKSSPKLKEIAQNLSQFASAKQQVTRSAESILEIAQDHHWKRTTKLILEIYYATDHLNSPTDYPKLNNIYSKNSALIKELIQEVTSADNDIKKVNSQFTEMHKGMIALKASYLALSQQKSIIEDAIKTVTRELTRVQNQEATVSMVAKDNADFAYIALALLGVMALVFSYRYGKSSDHLIDAYSYDKHVFKNLFDQAQLGWAIFGLSGKLLQSGMYFKNTISSLTKEDSYDFNSWSSIAEILNLTNSYNLHSLNEGCHQLSITINRPNFLPEDITLKITNCLTTKKVLVILHKEPDAPPMTLPSENKLHSINVNQMAKINVNTLVEESIEELTYFIQSKNIVLSLRTESDNVVTCDPETLKASIKDLVRDVGNYICTTGGKRKIDIFVFNEKEKSKISFKLYNSPVTTESVSLNISSSQKHWNLDKSVERLETELKDFGTRVTLYNNYDQKKNFVFANLNFQI